MRRRRPPEDPADLAPRQRGASGPRECPRGLPSPRPQAPRSRRGLAHPQVAGPSVASGRMCPAQPVGDKHGLFLPAPVTTSPVGLVPRSRMRRPLRHHGLLPPRGCPGWRAGPPGHAGVCVPVPQPLAGPRPPMRRQRPLWASWGAVHGSSRYPGAPVLGTVATVGARHQGPWLLEASVSSGVGWGRAPCGPLSGRIDCRTHPVEKPRPAPQRCG